MVIGSYEAHGYNIQQNKVWANSSVYSAINFSVK